MIDARPLRIGVVVIGRNEGERLLGCLRSCLGEGRRVVYVDSGSTDDSCARATELGAELVELDTTIPFTAARARNAGLAQLRSAGETPDFVQFVDGDCELDPGWLETGSQALLENERAAVVAGRRRERFPERTVYNALCDVEWDTPVGRAAACGGDFLARVSALTEVDGFREAMIGGEEPEMCLRLREAGWEIWRLDAEMTLHDAAIERLGQWWRRASRTGHAYAETAWLHGAASGPIGLRPLLSTLAWAVGFPVLLVLAIAWLGWSGLAIGLGLLYFQWRRIARGMEPRGLGASLARRYAAFVLLVKPAQLTGALRFATALLTGRERHLIEYKGAPGGGVR